MNPHKGRAGIVEDIVSLGLEDAVIDRQFIHRRQAVQGDRFPHRIWWPFQTVDRSIISALTVEDDVVSSVTAGRITVKGGIFDEIQSVVTLAKVHAAVAFRCRHEGHHIVPGTGGHSDAGPRAIDVFNRRW